MGGLGMFGDYQDQKEHNHEEHKQENQPKYVGFNATWRNASQILQPDLKETRFDASSWHDFFSAQYWPFGAKE